MITRNKVCIELYGVKLVAVDVDYYPATSSINRDEPDAAAWASVYVGNDSQDLTPLLSWPQKDQLEEKICEVFRSEL